MKFFLNSTIRSHRVPLTYIFYVLSVLILTPPAYAMDCISADSDPDGDGWGWENDMSCTVIDTDTPTLDPQQPPTCELENSDPDNDGWGWENDASCIADSDDNTPDDSGITPGSSAANAVPIEPGTTISNSLNGPNDEHWYSLTITNSSAAIEFAVNHTNAYSQRIDLESSEGITIATSGSFFFGSSQQNFYCLEAGTYYISSTVNYDDNESDFEYEFQTAVTDTRCLKPSFTHQLYRAELGVLPDGGYAIVTDNNQITIYAADGTPVTTIDTPDSINTLLTSDEGIIYLFTSGTITALDSSGNELWQKNSLGSLGGGNATLTSDGYLYVATYDSVIAITIDGTVDWMYQTPDLTRIEHIAKTTAGRILLSDNNRAYVLDPANL